MDAKDLTFGVEIETIAPDTWSAPSSSTARPPSPKRRPGRSSSTSPPWNAKRTRSESGSWCPRAGFVGGGAGPARMIFDNISMY